MKSRVISAENVTDFIKSHTTIMEFYNFVTQGRKNFNYNINNGGRCKLTALQKACYCQNEALVAALLEMGANPNQSRDYDVTPLHEAISVGNLNIVKLLLAHGAVCDVYALAHARQHGNKDIIDYLATQPLSQVSTRANHDDILALKFAVINNDCKLAEKILAENTINLLRVYFNWSDYATRFAAKKGNMEMVRLFAKYGDDLIDADNGLSDDNPKTTPEAAREAGHPEIAEFLETTQKQRYETLKQAAIMQQRKKLRSPTLFDNNADIAAEMQALFLEDTAFNSLRNA